MPGSRANASIRRATGSTRGAATLGGASYMPGRRRPPVTAAIFDSASSRDARRPSLTAATTRSWSISTSAASTAPGSIARLTSSWRPVTVALTAPPPAVPSTVADSSSDWTRTISCCICCAMRDRLAMLIGAILLLASLRPRDQSARCGTRVHASEARSAHLACVDQVFREDPTCFGEQPGAFVVPAQRLDREVGRYTTNGDSPTEKPADPILQDRPPTFGDVLEEALPLGKAQGHDSVLDRDRAAGHDQRLGWRMLADRRHDLRPSCAQGFEVGRRGGGGRLLGRGWWKFSGRRPRFFGRRCRVFDRRHGFGRSRSSGASGGRGCLVGRAYRAVGFARRCERWRWRCGLRGGWHGRACARCLHRLFLYGRQ